LKSSLCLCVSIGSANASTEIERKPDGVAAAISNGGWA
jgi:hypothetical protein